MKPLALLIFISFVVINDAAYTEISKVRWSRGPSAVISGPHGPSFQLPADFLPVTNTEQGYVQLLVDYFCTKVCEYAGRQYTGSHNFSTYHRQHETSSPVGAITALECEGQPTNAYVRKMGDLYVVYVRIIENDTLLTTVPGPPVL